MDKPTPEATINEIIECAVLWISPDSNNPITPPADWQAVIPMLKASCAESAVGTTNQRYIGFLYGPESKVIGQTDVCETELAARAAAFESAFHLRECVSVRLCTGIGRHWSVVDVIERA